MNATDTERPVVGAICSAGGAQGLQQLREIAEAGLTAAEVILYDGDTSPERREEINAFLEEAARLNIKVLLEPTWQPDIDAMPGSRIVTASGTLSTRQRGWGGFCYRNPGYQEAQDRFLEEVCEFYGTHDAILTQNGRRVVAVGHELQYQVTQEDGYGEPLSEMSCYCEHCIASFPKRLEERYGSVASYNEVHEAAIASFESVTPPKEPMPDRVLWQDWVDHHADAINLVLRRQRRVIERGLPGAMVTHEINDWYPNAWDSIYAGNHFWRMGAELEHAFNDQYPMEWAPGSLWRIYLYTFTQDANQSAVGFDTPFWTNGQAFNSWQGDRTEPPAVAAGEQMYSALIHGANGSFWWTSGGLLPKTKDASAEYRKLIEIIGDTRPAKDPVALLCPWTTFAQTREDDRGYSMMGAYQALTRAGYQIDIVDEEQITHGVFQQRGHKALCIWGNSSVLPKAREVIETYVNRGGLLLADYGDPDTAPYAPVFPETLSPEEPEPPAYSFNDGTRVLVRSRSQHLVPSKNCDFLASFSDGYPAVLRYGIGLGTMLRAGSMVGLDYADGMGLYDWTHQERVRIEPRIEQLVGEELSRAGIMPLAKVDNPNLEAGLFRLENCEILLVVNHLRHPANAMVSVLTDATAASDVFTGDGIDVAREGDRAVIELGFGEMGGRAVRLTS